LSFRTWIGQWRECMYATDPTSDMHWPVRIFCVVLTVLHAVEAPLSGTHHQGPGLAANWNDHTMRRSLSSGGEIPGGRKKLPLSLGFKCAYCGGEFGSRTGMDCHRRHCNSIGTPCADPMNSKSMSLTQRGGSYNEEIPLLKSSPSWHPRCVCTFDLPHHAQTLVCHFATRTLWHHNSCHNVYKLNNVHSVVIIVHKGKQSVLFLSENRCQKIYYNMLNQIIHFMRSLWYKCCKGCLVIMRIKVR
jgi:hypothetical protein